MASYRHLRDVDSTSANLRVKLTRSSSYAGTVNNGYDHHLSNNYFRKFKEQDKLRRSGSNFETFGSRYLSNTLKATNKGKEEYESNKRNIYQYNLNGSLDYRNCITLPHFRC